MWRKQRLWVLFLVLVGTGASTLLLLQHKLAPTLNSYIWIAYIPCGLLLGAALLYYRYRSYAQIQDGGLKISNLFSSIVIGYDLIRAARVQPLNQHFLEGRRKLVRPMGRRLLDKPALFVRLRGDDSQVAAIRKRLGRQLAFEDVVALPVPDPDALSWELTSRLPEKTGVNMGGARRRKRGR